MLTYFCIFMKKKRKGCLLAEVGKCGAIFRIRSHNFPRNLCINLQTSRTNRFESRTSPRLIGGESIRFSPGILEKQ